MWVPPNRASIRPVTAILMIIIMISSIPLMSMADQGMISTGIPTRDEGGPIVNRSVVEITLREDFSQIVGQYFNGTGFEHDDLFFDPNYEWDKVKYPLKPFEVRYPSGFNDDNTPIDVVITSDTSDVNFGKVTITSSRDDWNNIIYKKEWFNVTIFGRNRTGESTSQIKFKVANVNDRPAQISDKDFFSIKMPEDGSYIGINKNHEAINEIFGDLKDPFDTLTYTYDPVNDLAHNITVDLPANGSSVLFTPKENWSCPYLPNAQRLSGKNIGGDYINKFAVFLFNCSDQDGLYVRGELYVYVSPVNDVPSMEPLGEVEALEDELVTVQLEASDVDVDQSLLFGINITTSIYEKTQEQIEFQEDYYWDKDTGLLKFMTDNKLVGTYDVMAYVQDRSTESGRPDYPPTPGRIYQNFTLTVINVNDGPRAVLDQPLSSFIYNTSSVIEFDASRSADDDLIHGDILNYTWTKDGEVLGYGKHIFRTISTVGTYNITVNVTDSAGVFSTDWVTIQVEKARVPGEIFQGKDLDRSHTDNNTAIVISRTTKEVTLINGGSYSLDVSSVEGTRNGAIYKVRVMFAKELDFFYTEEIIQEPKLELYFLTDEFNETPIVLDPKTALDYVFPVPFSNVRYTRLQFDLRGPSATYPPSIIPLDTVRMLDGGMGVEITLTVVEMDDLGIKPDFDLYAVAQMKTTIKDANGQTLEVLNSWDSTGLGTKTPIITDAKDADGNGGDGDGFPLLVLVIILVMIIIVALVIVLFVFLSKGKKKEEEEPPAPTQPQVSVEEEVFGRNLEGYPNYPTAQQMYGQPVQEGLPPSNAADQPQGLPPAQMQQPQGVPQQVSQGQIPQAVPTPPPETQPQQPQYIPPQG